MSIAVAVMLPAGGLAAQEVDSTAGPCDGLMVRGIEVQTNRPQFRGVLAWWRSLARAMGLHHETTRKGLVRRFVSLEPGRPCTEFRRSESERMLRTQPYLSDASVTTTRVGNTVDVNVSTVDEVPVVAAARLSGANVRALSFGTMNFLGAGMHVESRWEQARGLRQGFGGKLAHPQLLGRPYAILAEGMQRPLGEHYTVTLGHPYYTDLQRIAWHTGYYTLKEFAGLRRDDHSVLLQPVDRSLWTVGGVIRIGPPRRLLLVGGMVLGERVVPSHEFSMVDSTTGRLVAADDTAGVRRYPTYDATHAAGVVGIRTLSFSRVRGFDALAADQDVATGTQVGAVMGVQPWSRFPLREAFVAVDAYVAGRSRRNFAGARAEVESRIDLERQEWQHLIGSGRAAWYFQPRERWISELSIEAAGGWRSIVPFQLELGDRRGGLRGYARSHEAGAQRVLARLEQRWDVARYQGSRAALGAAAFAEAGRMWAGDTPFGVDSPVRTSFGAAVLAAVPARSQRTMRAEVAIPTDRSRGARPELRFTVREPARGFWFEPSRIRWARLSAVPEQIFTWP